MRSIGVAERALDLMVHPLTRAVHVRDEPGAQGVDPGLDRRVPAIEIDMAREYVLHAA